MADLPEDAGWVEGVRAIEETDPVRFDIYNESLSALASRTKYLQENMGQGGGGRAPVEWLEPPAQEFQLIPVEQLQEGALHILDVRNEGYISILVNSPEGMDIPVGAEYHFVCAGDPSHAFIVDHTDAPPQVD